MANTAGSVLGAYIGMLGGADGFAEIFRAALLSQALMSAPPPSFVPKCYFRGKGHQVDTRVEVPNKNSAIISSMLFPLE
jgi:CNT family concentrative nucleoside transporter